MEMWVEKKYTKSKRILFEWAAGSGQGLRLLQLDGSLEGSQHILNKVLGVLDSDRETDQVLSDAKSSPVLSRDRSVGHGGRQLAQRLDTSERLGQGEELDVAQEGVGSGQVALDSERDHASESLLLRLCEGMLGVGGETRVDDVLDTGRSLESLSNSLGIRGVLTHAQVKGLQAAVGKEAVKGRGHGSDGVLEEGELGMDLLIGGEGHTHDNTVGQQQRKEQ